MEIIFNFSETLAELIADNQLTPELFAKAINIDRSVIYKYLRKECMPSVQNLIVIADYFKCSTDFLLGLTPENATCSFKTAAPFAERFKTLLKIKGKTRYSLHKEERFAKQSLIDWYYGKRVPNVDNIIKLAKCFDCSVDFLLGRE